MCLILFANNAHPKYKLILAANRDEFYKRPTRPAQWWEDKTDLLAGKDLEGRGTWMGISKAGRIAAVTNYRKLPVTEKYDSTRGKLVTEFLDSNISEFDYHEKMHNSRNEFDGYNLLFGNVDTIFWYSNKNPQSRQTAPTPVGNGVHGLSNELLDTPWPKVERGKEELSAIVNKNNDIDPHELFELLRNTDLAPDEKLPDTGIGIEFERILSAVFINSPDYGTRLSTVLLVDNNNKVYFEERAFVPESITQFTFTIAES